MATISSAQEMTQIKLTVMSKDTAREGARPIINVNTPNPGEWTDVGSIPLRKVRRLDVDEVLARSLPKLTAKVSRLSANEASSSNKE
jgi:hypothetical protein